MSNTKHTPGPWLISDVELGETKVYAKALNRPDRIVTATLDAHSAERNAKLIAAAPTLFAALQMIADSDASAIDAKAIARKVLAETEQYARALNLHAPLNQEG